MKLTSKSLNYIFIIFFALIIVCGGVYALVQRKQINYYENRVAYKINEFTFDSFIDKTFQDSIEKSLTDQIPLSITLKKEYNYYSNLLSINLTKFFIGDKCNNRYTYLSKAMKTYGCENYITYDMTNYSNVKEVLDNRIENINKVIKSSKIPVYVYFIESDSTINFETNEKSEISKVLRENIQTENFVVYEINNFDEYKKYFYKTDHHWNYKGSYKAYEDLVEILNLDSKIKTKSISCSSKRFSGSKAGTMGINEIVSEPFCVYDFNFKVHRTYINKQEYQKYGVNHIDDLETVTYGYYYGDDYAEIILDFNNLEKENILVIGESFDNALLNLLGTHYNKLYSIDLRHYENTFNQKFDYNKYIKDNKIDKVLFIGSMWFYVQDAFNLEVE